MSIPTLDNSFDRKFCINLDRRPDRWDAMQRKFAAMDVVSVERLAAVDSPQVQVPESLRHLRVQDYACTMSHLAAVKAARSCGARDVLIFEDDALFDTDFVTRFPGFIEQLPEDWHMLFLGAYHFENPVPVSRHIVRAVHALTAHAYAIRQPLFDRFIALNEAPPAIVDRNNVLLQAAFNCYCFEPNLVGQEGGYSDLMAEVMPEKPLTYKYPIQGAW